MATELPFLNSALRRLSLGNWTWLLLLLLTCRVMSAEPVAVRHREGTIHGFLLVRTLEGTAIATGDLVQVPHGDRINSRIVFRFKDGSIDDEATVYSQNGVFRLISDHHVQRGPSFPVFAGRFAPHSDALRCQGGDWRCSRPARPGCGKAASGASDLDFLPGRLQLFSNGRAQPTSPVQFG